jgi:CHASE3 domain sensor protein
MDDLQERMEIMEEGLLKCRQALEDGWEDENYRYIESSITRILYDLQEKIGLPEAGEIEKVMRGIKEKYGPGQMHLESAIGYLMHMEKEWRTKLRSGGASTGAARKWEDVFGPPEL